MAKNFFQDNAAAVKMDVYISNESSINGDMKTKSNIKIDGKVNGNVESEGTVHIGSDALVEGNVTGADVQIAGVVNGNITATEGLKLYGSSKLTGDVKAASMEVEKGALYKGGMVIGSEPVSTSTKTAKAPAK